MDERWDLTAWGIPHGAILFANMPAYQSPCCVAAVQPPRRCRKAPSGQCHHVVPSGEKCMITVALLWISRRTYQQYEDIYLSLRATDHFGRPLTPIPWSQLFSQSRTHLKRKTGTIRRTARIPSATWSGIHFDLKAMRPYSYLPRRGGKLKLVILPPFLSLNS